MELVVIRHGETQANAEGRYQGALDIGLNDDGVRQISCLAEKVAVAQQEHAIPNCGRAISLGAGLKLLPVVKPLMR